MVEPTPSRETASCCWGAKAKKEKKHKKDKKHSREERKCQREEVDGTIAEAAEGSVKVEGQAGEATREEERPDTSRVAQVDSKAQISNLGNPQARLSI